MNVIVNPDVEHPTHHISLSAPDGVTIGLISSNSEGGANQKSLTRAPVVRTAMKTTTGNAKYSDYEPPWSPIAQDDWSNGRGLDDFDKNTARYYDGFRANTMHGKIIHGPQEQVTTGIRSAVNNMPGSVKWWSLISGSGKYISNKFIPTANFTAANVWLLIRRKGTPTAALTLEIRSDSSGPDTVLKTMTVTTTDITDTLSQWWIFTIPSTQAVTSGTSYWLAAYSTAGTDDDHWEVACNPTATNGKQSTNGTTWTTATVDLYYRILDATTSNYTRFFMYKRAMYCVQSVASAASKLYINGDRGTADANTADKTLLADASKSAVWVTNEWVGCYVIITAGTGSNEEQTWRKIVSNNSTSLTCDTAWEITHDTTTEYVIVGSNKWTEITGTGITAKVTDVLVVSDIIYFAQGDAVNIRRIQFATAAGTWGIGTPADDGTNKAVYLKTVRDATSGATEIWKANNLDATSNISVAKASIAAWGTSLTFGTAITFVDSYGKITGLEEYGDTNKYLWVFREGTIYAIVASKPDEIPLREIRALMSESNGKAHTVHNTYMYINIGSGVEQYYNRQLTDMGSNKDEGLPSDRQGPVSAMQGYPGKIFEAIDAGTTGYSQIHGYNMTGWCEMYRAPLGQRITCLDYQVIPDKGLDRMWFVQGSDIFWLPFPSGTLDSSKDSNFLFTHEAAETSGWMYAGLPDVVKLYNKFKLFAENLAAGSIYAEVDYQVDQDTTWTPIKNVFEVSPTSEFYLNEDSRVQGKRLRYRLRTYTTDASKTPIVKSTVVETISRIPIKYSYALAYRIIDDDVNLCGEKELAKAEDIQIQLDSWASELTPLKMRSIKRIFDNKTVFIDPAPISILGDKLEKYTGKLTMIEV